MTRTAELTHEGMAGLRPVADVDIVIPVYNEEAALEGSVLRLLAYLSDRFPVPATITIVDNASTEQTWGIACRLADQQVGVRAVHLDAKGRGRALRSAWLSSIAPVVAYMDVDLSTDLDALLPLVAPLLSGHSDLAIGSRLAPGARVVRGPKREVISRGYNLLLRATLRNGFSDAQCGFKALRADVARALVPLVEDDGWFFDTELLVLAEHNGLRIHEVPVDWVDDPDSRVDVRATAREDLLGIWRLIRRFAAGEGNIAAAVNLVANRRVTFARRGRTGRRREYLAGTAVAALPLVATLAAIGALRTVGVSSVPAALAAVTAVNAAATAGRFLVLRRRVFA